MNKFKLYFCLFLFVISFLYAGDMFKQVSVLEFLTKEDKSFNNFLFSKTFESPSNLLDIKGIGTLEKNKLVSKNKSFERKENFKNPIIYIYNTHETEEYQRISNSITPTVKTVSDILKEELALLEIPSLVEKRSITKEVKRRNLDYTGTYEVSFDYLKHSKKKYPSLKYYFDMHRDSVPSYVSKTVIEGKNYATIMFLVGTKNENYKKNDSHLKVMEKYLNKNYPGLVRSTYYQKHSGFNQFYDENMFLVELGAEQNTLEEIYNSTSALAKAIKYYVEDSYEK